MTAIRPWRCRDRAHGWTGGLGPRMDAMAVRGRVPGAFLGAFRSPAAIPACYTGQEKDERVRTWVPRRFLRHR